MTIEHYHGTVIMLIGPPLSGKGTQANMLKKVIGGWHLSTGEILRERRKKSKLPRYVLASLEAGMSVSDTYIVQKIVLPRMRDVPLGTPLIFDGVPRTPNQARQILSACSNRGYSRSIAIVLSINDYNALEYRRVHRLPAEERPDDNKETFKNRLGQYAEQERRLLEQLRQIGAIVTVVLGNHNPEEVHQRVFATVRAAVGVPGVKLPGVHIAPA